MKKELLLNLTTGIIIILMFIYVFFQLNGYIIDLQSRNNPINIERTGSLYINTNPENANVYINEIEYITPITLNALSAGNYAVRIKKSGYEDYMTTIDIVSGSVKFLDVKLIPTEIEVEYANLQNDSIISKNDYTSELFILNQKDNILEFQIFNLVKDLFPLSEYKTKQRTIYLGNPERIKFSNIDCNNLHCILQTDTNYFIGNLESGILKRLDFISRDNSLTFNIQYIDEGKRIILKSARSIFVYNIANDSFDISYLPDNLEIIEYTYRDGSFILVLRDLSTRDTFIQRL